MNLDDNELRQAYAAMESYKERVEALSRQIQVLRMSLDEVNLAAGALTAFKDAKEGDEIMVPIGAQSLITVKVTSNKNAVVGVGAGISVEKSAEDAIAYMEANGAEITEALKKTTSVLSEAQQALSTLSQAVQQEYAARQQSGTKQ